MDNYGSGMTFYEEGTTNASGQATINVDVPSSGTVYIGAWKHDYRYDIKWVVIGSGLEGASGDAGNLWMSSPQPNPVTTAASVAVSVPASGNVNLSVYDVSGRMIDIIYQGQMDAGTSLLEWSPGGNVSSGMYFLKLDTPAGSVTTRTMVIR